MARTNYAGIDYGLGRSNVDTDTGIRFGVINRNRLFNYGADSLEEIYACGCPHCGADIDPDELCDEYECECGHTSPDYDCWSDEPIGCKYEGEGLVIEGSSDGDLFIVKSPVKVRAQFCSPCAPGAGHLENPCDDGPWAYALPMDWFGPDWPAPYQESDLHPVDSAE